jgi:hypothetical protein
MRNCKICALFTLISLLVASGYALIARDGGGGHGGGGGRGGGGGGGRGGHGGGAHGGGGRGYSGAKVHGGDFSRGGHYGYHPYWWSPSMSTAERYGADRRVTTQYFYDFPESGQGPVMEYRAPRAAAPSQIQARDQVKQFQLYSKMQGKSKLPIKEGDIETARGIQERRVVNRQAELHLEDKVRGHHPEYREWFNDQFFEKHHFHHRFFYPGYNWWIYPTWAAVTGWLPWGWSAPIYYDDLGSPMSMPQQIEPPPPETPAPPEAAGGEWLALGVFALGKDVALAAYSNLFLQLAIDKGGDIAGTYYNAATDKTYAIEGSVDKDTQQAAWKLSSDPNAPIMTAGLYNLTQEMCPVQVRFPDATTQSWVLVRVNK